jgi:large subunit ribosomal protein L6
MSRIGKKQIVLPAGVTLNYSPENRLVEVSGPLGKLSQTIQPFVSLKMDGDRVSVLVDRPDTKYQAAIWGTTRAIINNMVDGVSKGFSKEMELNGVGYKMELGSELILYIGYSHPVKVTIPQGITLTLNKNVLSGKSIDKQLLGNFFTNVHNMKPCDVYKQKGFKFPDRFYRKKAGKKAK